MSETNLAAVVLAAGAGTRLRPLTTLRPKALCPVDNVPLVDRAIERTLSLTTAIAVNVHFGREMMVEHLSGRVHLSIEHPAILGGAGALGALREWIDGRDVLLMNADAYLRGSLGSFDKDWDGTRPRLLTIDARTQADFGMLRYVGAALLPWHVVREFRAVPRGLYEACFRPYAERGELDLVQTSETFIDCGTIGGYHAANMHASGGENVIGLGAVVEGSITRTVVWPNSRVDPGEMLDNAVRADGITVFAA